MNITIHSAEDANPDMLAACIKKAAQYNNHATTIAIDCSKRTTPFGAPEWSEYTIKVDFSDESSLFITAIRRTNDSQVEFHT